MRPERRRRTLAVTPCAATQLPGLRRWLRSALAGRDHDGDVELVCTELVTNAVDHGGGAQAVRIAIDERDVRIEVDDADPDGRLRVGRSRVGTHRGRGLAMIDAVAVWGVARFATGKTVWARLPVDRAGHGPTRVA